MAPPKVKLVVKELETKQLLCKVLTFFKREDKNGKPISLHNPIRRLAKASGLSERTIRRATEGPHKAAVRDVVNSLHESAVKKSAPKPKKLDGVGEEAVRRTILRKSEKKEVITIKKVHADLKEQGIEASQSTVARTVKKLGFRYSSPGTKKWNNPIRFQQTYGIHQDINPPPSTENNEIHSADNPPPFTENNDIPQNVNSTPFTENNDIKLFTENETS